MTAGLLRFGSERIRFEVAVRPTRKTLGIEVHPDGSVRVLSPSGCDPATIDQKLQLRAAWISRQLAMFARFERHQAPRRYLSGESHRYLGRQYRLRVLTGEASLKVEQVKLTRGEMRVLSPTPLPPERVKDLLHRWYLGRAREIFEVVLDRFFGAFERLGHARPRVQVRDMRSRWGSLSPNGQMTLNTRLIQTPRPCIEYVIVHELCHLARRNHGPAFYALLEKLMPDWQARKRRLEEALLSI